MAISKRYLNDGKGSLDSVQLKAKEKLLKDIESGRIRFVEDNCLCGETPANSIVISEKEFHGFPLNIRLCGRCAVIYCEPYLDLESLGIFYREYYRDLYEGELITTISGRFDTQRKEGAEIYEFIKGSLASMPKMNVLEVGAATGGLLDVFKEAGHGVAGIDLDDRYLEFGRSRGLKLINSSIEDFAKTPAEKYDLVVMCHIFEHVHDPKDVLRLLRNIIPDNGYFLCDVPNIDLSYIELSQFQLAHKWYFDEITISDLLERSGFEVVAVDTKVHLKVLGRLKPGSKTSGEIVSRADYALDKYRRGLRFERLAPFIKLAKILRINNIAKYLYYKLFIRNKT